MTPATALLELLDERGIAAWIVDTDDVAGVRLLVEVGGLEGAVGLLVRRGFVLDVDALPERVELAHPRHDRIVLLPVGFAADGSALWHRNAGLVRVPPAAFDPFDRQPRRVRWHAVDDPQPGSRDEPG